MQVSDLVVVVPAHDEQGWLAGCLGSVARAAEMVAVPVRVVVVLDACTDATAAEVPAGLSRVVIDEHNVGAARAAGFAAATAGPRTWFATTDADSRVPDNWLSAQLVAAHEHDVFVGTVRVVDWSGRAARVAHMHDSAYAGMDGHRHVHGANLGLSAVAYAQLGGFSPLAVHEDADLVSRAEAAGLRVARSAAASVTTSARVSHRTPDGFSATLDRLAHADLEAT